MASYVLSGGWAGRLRGELRHQGSKPLHPGQLSVGLNPGISTIPLLFDQELGTITLQMGRNIELGGRARTPRLSAYVTVRGGTLRIDGDTVVKDGELAGP